MAESRIPVDLLNPGQVFACLGIMEATEVLLGDVKGAFDWNSTSQTVFRISASGFEEPVPRVMRFFEEAEISARAPEKSICLDKWDGNWGEPPEQISANTPFSGPSPDMPAKLPAVLRDRDGNELTIEYWNENYATKRDNMKFWAGARGKPGVSIVRDAIESIKGMIRQSANDPFALKAKQTISLRFDWRRDYIPVQDGFSPNQHRSSKIPISMVGYPIVEVLAAIGMTNARPCPMSKTKYRYSVLGCFEHRLTDLIFHRAALGSEPLPIPGWPSRRFLMHLDWPGREGDARCITQVTEETIFHGISTQ